MHTLPPSELYPFCFILVVIMIFAFVYSLNFNRYVFDTTLPWKTLQALYCHYTCMTRVTESSS